MEDYKANTEQRLTRLCCEFTELDDSDKDCILRISQALSFAARKPDFTSLSYASRDYPVVKGRCANGHSYPQ
ncbi:MAG: hypothetical protein LBU17_07605 [Treponema sp.]|jgi:hypothetical protein|nr:hypothetical protein [Treponema sp.]